MTTKDTGLPPDLKSLHETTLQIEKAQAHVDSLLKKRANQIRAVLAKGIYTQSSIIDVVGVSKTRFTVIKNKIAEEDSAA